MNTAEKAKELYSNSISIKSRIQNLDEAICTLRHYALEAAKIGRGYVEISLGVLAECGVDRYNEDFHEIEYIVKKLELEGLTAKESNNIIFISGWTGDYE